jgi:hypothetical protein
MRYIVKDKKGKGFKALSTKHLQGCSYTNDIKDDKTKGTTIRTDILIDLLKEQNYNCAYCMKEITIDNATIEHIISQSFNNNSTKYVYNTLVEKYTSNIENIVGKIKTNDKNSIGNKHDTNYANMLAVCKGNSCGNSSHCDASRSVLQDKRPLLFISPLNKIQMSNIRFSKTGLIYYKEPIVKESLEAKRDYLNLDEDSNIRYDLYYVLNLNCDSIKEQRERVLGAIKSVLIRLKFNHKMVKSYLASFETKDNRYSRFSEKYGEFSQVAIFELKKHIKE